jgi:hypothetical protein
MIEILGISIEGYEILHFVSTFFLSEKNPKNIVRIGFKVIFKKLDKEVGKEQREVEMKIFLKLNPISKIYNEKDISYKLKEETYKKGIGVKYEKVTPAKITKIETDELSSSDFDLKTKKLLNHQAIKINLKMDNKNNNEEGNFLGILIRVDIENEGIESESLLKRAMGLSKYAWNFHTCLWGEHENAYPHGGRNVNPCEEIQTFLILPEILYKSFGQINVLPGAYSIHTVKNRDVDSLSLEPPETPGEEKGKSEKKEVREWYKAGGFMINWRFEKTHRMSREVIVEHIESFPRLSMLFLICSLLSVMSICLFSEDIHREFFDGTTYTTFRILSIFVVSIVILFIYILINLKNYAFHEIRAPDEIASYIYYSCLLVLVSFIPSSIFLWGEAEKAFFEIFRSREYLAIAIILICAYVLIYTLTPWKTKKKFRMRYVLALLPVLALAMVAFAVTLASNYTIREFSVSWAYLCATSVAILELRELLSMSSS